VSSIINKSGLTTSRQNPQTIRVEIHKLTIKDGKLTQNFFTNIDIQPPLARMTVNEMNEEIIEMIKDIPQEFHFPLTSVAWDKGHSAGYEEVISELLYLISKFTPSIREYKKNILKEFESVCLVGSKTFK